MQNYITLQLAEAARVGASQIIRQRPAIARAGEARRPAPVEAPVGPPDERVRLGQLALAEGDEVEDAIAIQVDDGVVGGAQVAAIVEDIDYLERLLKVRDEIPTLSTVVVIDDPDGRAPSARAGCPGARTGRLVPAGRP